MKARQMAPCLLILEDIDTLVDSTNRSYFFNEVDGLENNDGILMIATTNYRRPPFSFSQLRGVVPIAVITLPFPTAIT